MGLRDSLRATACTWSSETAFPLMATQVPINVTTMPAKIPATHWRKLAVLGGVLGFPRAAVTAEATWRTSSSLSAMFRCLRGTEEADEVGAGANPSHTQGDLDREFAPV